MDANYSTIILVHKIYLSRSNKKWDAPHLNIDIHHHAEIQFPAFEWFDRIQLIQDLMMTLGFCSCMLPYWYFSTIIHHPKNSTFTKIGRGADIILDRERSDSIDCFTQYSSRFNTLM